MWIERAVTVEFTTISPIFFTLFEYGYIIESIKPPFVNTQQD